jgi:hypothetical protein
VDDKPAPTVPEPLFPMLRRLGAADVQHARAWLLAWLLARLGERVQEPPPPAWRIERSRNGEWTAVVGPFHRAWIAVQIARECQLLNPRWRYRVVGPEGTIEVSVCPPQSQEVPHGE